jgi:hypothetical protein
MWVTSAPEVAVQGILNLLQMGADNGLRLPDLGL